MTDAEKAVAVNKAIGVYGEFGLEDLSWLAVAVAALASQRMYFSLEYDPATKTWECNLMADETSGDEAIGTSPSPRRAVFDAIVEAIAYGMIEQEVTT